jgi:RNA polymerase sigma-70 factor (ECF subfamily)
MAEPTSDAARWLPAARAGSQEALGQALEACRRYLLLVADRELDPGLRAKGGASDLVQQTFLEAQQNFARFQGDSEEEWRAWLRQVLRHNLADFTRRYRGVDKRQVGREVSLEPDTPSGGRDAGLVADTPSPSGRAIAHEQEAALQRALAQLPADYRRVIVLRHQEGRSFEEIGQQLNRSSEAARKLWSRAIERLQEALDTGT